MRGRHAGSMRDVQSIPFRRTRPKSSDFDVFSGGGRAGVLSNDTLLPFVVSKDLVDTLLEDIARELTIVELLHPCATPPELPEPE